MNAIRNMMSRVFSKGKNADPGDLLLGLPLEAGEKRIYPVYTRHGHINGSRSVQAPQQIGYIEITNSRATFTSFERGFRWLAGAVPVGLFVAAGIWLARRRFRIDD
jgi:hypothetical protein